MMRERLFTILAVLAIALGFGLATQPTPGAEAQSATFYREVVFDSANVMTATESSAAVTGLSEATLAAFQTVCTEDSGTATNDIAIQRSIDGGTTWSTIVSFTQLTATGGQTLLYADVRSASPQMIGNRLRVTYTIGGTGQYTCSVYGVFEA